ncbi:MAG: helix-turn-helix transcriptional regulator [Agriterribacter sp.]
MRYRQISPTLQLQPYVHHFGVLENDHTSSYTKTFKIIADGCPGLIFQENPNSFLDKDYNKLPQLFLHGLTSSFSQKTVKGNYYNIGVYCKPHALKSIFGINADELTDTYVSLDEVMKNNLSEQLLHEHSIDKRIGIITDFLCRQIDKNKHRENLKAVYAIRKINTDTVEDLDAIRSALNISERSLERIFKTNVGISPKLFFRICRFQAALDDIRTNKLNSLTGIAHQHSYADQSHFIRDFKAFTGVSPKQFLSHASELAVNFPEWKS